MAGRGPRFGVRIDWISDVLIATFFLTTLFAGLGGLLLSSQASYNLFVFMVVFQLTAVALWVVSKTYVVASDVSRADFARDAKYIMAGLAGFFFLNVAVPLTLPFATSFFQGIGLATTGPGPKFVTVMMSIPEESLFRGWAAPWFARKTGFLGGVVGSASAFTIYHFFVYGDSPASLIFVFGAGIIAGAIVLKLRRLYPTMSMHFLSNLIAVGLH